MDTNPYAGLFRPVAEFEAKIRGLSAEEQRQAKIDELRKGIEAYWAEVHWKRQCRPPYWVQCLIPLLWPVLFIRGAMSKTGQSAFAEAIHERRRRWQGDLVGADLSFEGIVDPFGEVR